MDNDRIERSIKRISIQILEENYKENQVFLIGIKGMGFALAERIFNFLNNQNTETIFLLHAIEMDKNNPLKGKYNFVDNVPALENSAVLLIDDVLNSGKTLMHAASHLLQFNPKSLQTVVLLDRVHRKFPIKANIVGMSINTTIQSHIEVDLNNLNSAAYLI